VNRSDKLTVIPNMHFAAAFKNTKHKETYPVAGDDSRKQVSLLQLGEERHK